MTDETLTALRKVAAEGPIIIRQVGTPITSQLTATLINTDGIIGQQSGDGTTVFFPWAQIAFICSSPAVLNQAPLVIARGRMQ